MNKFNAPCTTIPVVCIPFVGDIIWALRGSIPNKTLLLRLLLLLHHVVLLHHPLRRHDTRLLHHDLLLTLNHHGAMLTCHHASSRTLLSHNALHSHVTTLRINHLGIIDRDVSVPLLRLQRKYQMVFTVVLAI